MPSIGGGTANSEFEVLTGMDLDHFGFGEYPYTTILSSRACESIAADLHAKGYGTHALHNHTATFYNRHIVYSNLGFDSFTPAELMNGLTYNPLGWERDEVLTDEIISALDMTEGEDFVFAVTVQGHGKYPDELPNETDSYPDYELEYGDEPIKVSSVDADIDERTLAQYTYYVNQLHETDEFIGELIKALEERGEPCVVVFYGDHLPALPLTDAELVGTLYDPDYAVWTNTELFDGSDGSLDRDFEAYMLSPYILSLCGINGGDIMDLHVRELATGETLNDELRLLEYVQLYDEEGGEYQTVEMRFGTRTLSVSGCLRSGNTLYIFGSGFTKNCVVRIGGFPKTSVFISPEVISVENVYFNDSAPQVDWTAEDGTILCSAIAPSS
ncbi:MAG: LTA synthase family protein, partial [Candidatus Flemingiibacterium sp.]